jgi:hypothetical protein
MRQAGHVAHMGKMRNAYKILVGKPKGKEPFGRPRRRWEVIIRIDLRETGWGGVYCIHLAQDRVHWWIVVNTVMSHRVS